MCVYVYIYIYTYMHILFRMCACIMQHPSIRVTIRSSNRNVLRFRIRVLIALRERSTVQDAAPSPALHSTVSDWRPCIGLVLGAPPPAALYLGV